MIASTLGSRHGAGRHARLAPALEDLRCGRFELAALSFEAAGQSSACAAQAAVLAAEARLLAGMAQVHAGDFSAARCDLEQALRLDPGQAAAARMLARVLLRSGEPELALRWLDHAAIDGAETHGIGILRAACLDTLGRREDAIHALDRALMAALAVPLPLRHRRGFVEDDPASAPRAEPRLDDAHQAHADRRCELALRLFQTKPAEAAQHLETALALNPRFLRARLVLGLIRLGQRRAREAVEELEAARELEPTYPDIRAWLGLARLAAGDARGAARSLERAVALRREFSRAHRHLALAQHALGFTAEALRAARRGWIRDTEVPTFGRPALSGLEAEAADEPALRRALAIRPRSPDLQLALGRRLASRGDHSEARAVLRAALTQRPGYPAATLELARNEIASSRMRDAETHLESLVRSRPSWVDAQALLGRTRLLLGDPGGALAPLRAAVRQRPDLEPARSDLAWAMMGHAGRAAPRRNLSGFSA